MVELKCIPITHTYTMFLHSFDCVKGTSIRSSVALNCTIKNDDDIKQSSSHSKTSRIMNT